MAFGICRTLFNRLSEEDRFQLKEMLPQIMIQHQVGEHGFELVQHHIEEFERQPMIEVEAYRQKVRTVAVAPRICELPTRPFCRSVRILNAIAD